MRRVIQRVLSEMTDDYKRAVVPQDKWNRPVDVIDVLNHWVAEKNKSLEREKVPVLRPITRQAVRDPSVSPATNVIRTLPRLGYATVLHACHTHALRYLDFIDSHLKLIFFPEA